MIERRKQDRVVSMFRSAYVRAANGLHFVSLRNISDSGVCFDAYPGVAVGDPIEFCFDSTGAKFGTVMWLEGGRFGVSTDGSLMVPTFSVPPYKSRSVRLPLSVKAQIFTHQGSSQVSVLNLSTRGTCIDHVHGLQRGQLVSITIGGCNFEVACVRWTDGAHAGIAFAQPVPRCKFRQLVDRLQERPITDSSGEDAAGRSQGSSRVTQGEELPPVVRCA